MKRAAKVLLMCMALGVAGIGAGEPKCYPEVEREVMINKLGCHLDSCRDAVRELSNNNERVMNQFEIFAKSLLKTYWSGKGYTYKEMIRMIDAVEFAAEKHRFQVRKDPEGTPYIIHPIGVAHHLLKIGEVRDADIIIGALLHDTVEDTETTFEEIAQRFGSRVVGFVKEVTDDKTLPKEERKQLQIDHAPGKSAGAAQIKLADKLYNLADLANNPPSEWTVDYIDGYFVWAQKVINALPWVNKALFKEVNGVIEDYWDSKEDSKEDPSWFYN